MDFSGSQPGPAQVPSRLRHTWRGFRQPRAASGEASGKASGSALGPGSRGPGYGVDGKMGRGGGVKREKQYIGVSVEFVVDPCRPEVGLDCSTADLVVCLFEAFGTFLGVEGKPPQDNQNTLANFWKKHPSGPSFYDTLSSSPTGVGKIQHVWFE